MADTATEPTLLDKLRETRNGKVDAWAEFINKRETERATFESRSQTDEFSKLAQELRDAETQTFRDAEAAFKAESDQRKAEIEEFDSRVKDQESIERRKNEAAAASASPKVSIGNEPTLYRRDTAHAGEQQLSYYRDLAMVHGPGITLRTGGTRDQAQARLIRHAEEMDVLMPQRAKELERRARAQIAKAENDFLYSMSRSRNPAVDRVLQEMRNGLSFNPFEQRVTPNQADGTGGYFIPPLWLIDEFIPGLRAHLVLAALCRQMDLPPGTDSINIPKLSTLTAVGYQQVNNSGLVSQDWTDTYVQANVKTAGGFSDVALQLLELSPINVIDEVITTDLMAAYNTFLDGEVIHGDGVNATSLNGGHLLGIYPYTNWSANNVTYTEASPVPAHMAPGVFGPMYGKVATTRFDTTGFKIVIHGSRYAYYSSGLDTSNKPIGESGSGGAFNIHALEETPLQARGLVAKLTYLADTPVYIDNNIGITDTTGGGTNQDYAIGGLFDTDAWLFKSPLRTDVFREPLSGSLGVRFRVYNYVAFLLRYGQGFAVATGSGFAKPSTGYGDFFR